MTWISFMVGGWGTPFSIYFVVQVVAAFALRGKYRWLPCIPIPFMLGVLAWTVYAYQVGGNLWPVLLIFTSPVATALVLFLWYFGRHAGRAAHPGAGTTCDDANAR